jgi:cytoskeletal protein CcmA (bactofilin family)
MDKLKSFLGSQSEMRGELSSKGILRLDGVVFGKIHADQVILSETAVVHGEIAAGKIIVGGSMEGVLRAEDLVEIRSKGKVKGEVFARRFVIADGGVFNGRIEMKPERPNIVDFETRRMSQGGQ